VRQGKGWSQHKTAARNERPLKRGEAREGTWTEGARKKEVGAEMESAMGAGIGAGGEWRWGSGRRRGRIAAAAEISGNAGSL
jgi:hypothetical protein